MGAFVLGVLVGWLAEWLFYTFWVKAGDNGNDCSDIKAELDLKNRQITSLQTQLASATGKSASSKSSSTANTKKQASKSAVTATSKASTTVTAKKASGSAAATTANAKPKGASKKPAPATAKKSATDNLTKVEGIGPKASAAFKAAGINTFAELAATSVPALQKILNESEGRFGGLKPGSWPKQAKMAADGKWDELKKWQDEHDGGIE